MADFSRPEYASYLEFARDVAVERIPQDGDYYVEFCGDRKPIVKGPITAFGWRVSPWPDVQEYGCSFYWLPTLADWLERLDEVGAFWVRLETQDHYRDSRPEILFLAEAGLRSRQRRSHFGPTREEAAARLYVAVTRSPADPAPPPAAR